MASAYQYQNGVWYARLGSIDPLELDLQAVRIFEARLQRRSAMSPVNHVSMLASCYLTTSRRKQAAIRTGSVSAARMGSSRLDGATITLATVITQVITSHGAGA